ncbi:MAG: hypothetical protein KGQ28_01650 [Hyphomicrobiales bacterium]|nr:hypothetical protein [Hyphomicrobiales bacterium]
MTECLYSGPLDEMVFHSSGPPLRFELGAHGRSVIYVHKVQTNFDPGNPFKPALFGERPTCRLKLDCTVAAAGLKSIHVLAVSNGYSSEKTSGPGSARRSISNTPTPPMTRVAR